MSSSGAPKREELERPAPVIDPNGGGNGAPTIHEILDGPTAAQLEAILAAQGSDDHGAPTAEAVRRLALPADAPSTRR